MGNCWIVLQIWRESHSGYTIWIELGIHHNGSAILTVSTVGHFPHLQCSMIVGRVSVEFASKKSSGTNLHFSPVVVGSARWPVVQVERPGAGALQAPPQLLQSCASQDQIRARGVQGGHLKQTWHFFNEKRLKNSLLFGVEYFTVNNSETGWRHHTHEMSITQLEEARKLSVQLTNSDF